MPDYETSPDDSAYHRTLPIGTQLSAEPLVDDDLSCFESVTLKALAPMLVPEQPRAGVLDPASCSHCRPSEHTIWRDDLWHVNAGWTTMGLPYVGGLAPNQHCRLDDAPVEVLAVGRRDDGRAPADRGVLAGRGRGRSVSSADCDLVDDLDAVLLVPLLADLDEGVLRDQAQ